MRATHLAGLAIALLVAAACGDSTSVANSCGSSGANANVNTTSSNSFSPNATTITLGQSVCWQNSSGSTHTVTAGNGAFNTSLPAGQIFVASYSTAGTFPYSCTLHAGMNGTVTVN